MSGTPLIFSFFFFNDTATTEIYTLSLHDALPISHHFFIDRVQFLRPVEIHRGDWPRPLNKESLICHKDRKSTRLNSSHGYISYAVFCLKKKNTTRSRISSSYTGAH